MTGIFGALFGFFDLALLLIIMIKILEDSQTSQKAREKE